MSEHLSRIDSPNDLKALSVPQLEELAAEVRELIIDTVSVTGGHLAANLGVVELTIALLYVFDPPADRVVWDVSHQGYAWKILTGRRDRMDTLRQMDGLSGFLKRSESDYDAFGAGHAGTALSAALGMAAARDCRGGDESVIAVLGDAAAGCGIALEALNNVASTTNRAIVILNDNEMSIDANVGALSRSFGRLLTSRRYNHWKRAVEKTAMKMKMGIFRNTYHRIEEAIKGMFLRSPIFEELGLRYVGPVDGHDLETLINALSIARLYERPLLLHVATQKGRGYSFAEEAPQKWHGTSCFHVETGTATAAPSTQPTYSAVFGDVMIRLADEDERVVAITAAMCSNTGLSGFASKYPKRLFDVGISEEHAAIFAAGLAADGYRPFFAVYSTFSQRVVDCIIHDVCLQKLPVVFCLDRAGVVGDDGPTHHGVFDIALLRAVPNLVIMQPRDEAELARMLRTALSGDSPAVIRYPRGTGPGVSVPETIDPLPLGRAEVLRPGKDVWLWALGDMVPTAMQTAALLDGQDLVAGVVDARFVRPLDEALLLEQAAGATIVTLENGTRVAGFGSAVQECLADNGVSAAVLRCGWPDAFVPQGKPAQLLEKFGLTPEALAAQINVHHEQVANGS